MQADIALDRDVRDWVLAPLTACIALMMLMRQYATVRGRNEGFYPLSRPCARA